jgi:hypothetical protein
MAQPNRTRWKARGANTLFGTYSRHWPVLPGAPHPDPIVHWSKINTPHEMWRYMVDTHGFLQDDFNPCYHERYLGLYDFPYYISWTAADGVHQISTSYRRQLEDPVRDCRMIQLPLGTWLEDFSARAEHHFITLVETDYSLINFIIEMIELCEGNVNVLVSMKNAIESAIRGFRRAYERSGSYWLAWNFAIKPTLKDIWNMFHTYRRAQKRLEWLKKRNHKDTKVHYREGPRQFSGASLFEMAKDDVTQPYYEPPPELFGDPPAWQEWYDWIVLKEHCEVEYEATVTLTAWAWIRFDIPDMLLEGMAGLGIVIAAMQGLYNPLAIGWEAVPFSWLIDWFRTEAHKLRELVKSDLNPLGYATLKQAGWTAKVKIFGEFFHMGGTDSDPSVEYPNGWTRTAAGSFKYQLYNRQPNLPEVSDNPFRIPWEWYQASILASLIQQKRRR